MTDLEYRRLPRYANSDLSELLALHTGKPLKPAKPETLQFGTTFHKMILEPDKLVDWSLHHVTEHAKLLEMQNGFNQFATDTIPRWSEYRKEFILQDTDPATGLPIKAKIDAALLFWTHGDVIDVKTTSAKDSQAFYDSLVEYGYDRQSAFYLDLIGVDFDFIFIGVQKIKPFDVFTIDMSISADRRRMIDEGRRKNAQLLKVAKRESERIGGWRPSSWSR